MSESKKASAQKELSVLLKIIEAKKPFLESLLAQIKESEKVLEDGFSHKKLELEREYREKKQNLDAEVESVSDSIVALKREEARRRQDNLYLDKQHTDLCSTINDQKGTLSKLKINISRLESDITSLRSLQTELRNDVDARQKQKDDLDATIGDSILRSQSEAFKMRADFKKEHDHLEKNISLAKNKLVQTQLRVSALEDEATLIVKQLEERESDLTQRENALIIKTKAFDKKNLAFETEVRRYNYIKPLR